MKNNVLKKILACMGCFALIFAISLFCFMPKSNNNSASAYVSPIEPPITLNSPDNFALPCPQFSYNIDNSEFNSIIDGTEYYDEISLTTQNKKLIIQPETNNFDYITRQTSFAGFNGVDSSTFNSIWGYIQSIAQIKTGANSVPASKLAYFYTNFSEGDVNSYKFTFKSVDNYSYSSYCYWYNPASTSSPSSFTGFDIAYLFNAVNNDLISKGLTPFDTFIQFLGDMSIELDLNLSSSLDLAMCFGFTYKNEKTFVKDMKPLLLWSSIQTNFNMSSYYEDYYNSLIKEKSSEAYSNGYLVGLSDSKNTSILPKTILAFASYPFTIMSGFLNFNLFGFNLYNLLLAFVTTIFIIWLIRRFK